MFEAALPLRTPFAISGGTMTIRRSIVVELSTADGSVGYGESAPFERPFYSAETISSARACLEEVLAPRIVGTEMGHPQALHELLCDGVRGNAMARAGLETAYWDLVARREGCSLARLVERRLEELGVAESARTPLGRFPCGVALGIPPDGRLDTLVGDVQAAIAVGYHRVKLKVRPGWDVAPIGAAAEAIAESGRPVGLTVDANGAYELALHQELLDHVDELGLLYIEQPFAPGAFWDAQRWNMTSKTPVCLDESLVDDETARQIVEMDGPTVWNLKVQRLGGLEETCRVYRRGVEEGIRLWVGTMPETGLGAQAALAVAGLPGMAYPSDLEPSERWYAEDADLVPLELAPDGTMAVPAAPPLPRLEGLAPLADIRA